MSPYSSLKVLYDGQAFDMQTHGGVSRCFAELYKHLPQTVDADVVCLETDNVYMLNLGFKHKGTIYDGFLMKGNNAFKKFCYKIRYNFKYGKYSHWDKKPLLNNYETELRLQQGDFDIFHPTFFDPYFLPYLKGKPFVLTVHDMIPELYPQYYPSDEIQLTRKKKLIPLADHIVAVSENTKKDIMKFFDVPEEKISVVYHGTDTTPYYPTPNSNKYGKYVLYVGERQWYKNFNGFIKEMLPILERHKDLKIVCTGKPFSSEEQAIFNFFSISDRIEQLFVNGDQEFMDLYHNAICFVYPSEYEGFGIPILEAYKADCIVMLNHASCFPEIAGDAAVYFHMKDGESDFEEQFEKVYSMSSKEREALLQKQRERLTLYTWGNAARQLAEVYKKVLK